MQQVEPNKYVKELTQEKYKYGFTTEVHTDIIERGLNEDVIRLISSKKNEPEWLLEFRLKAYRYWLTLVQQAGDSFGGADGFERDGCGCRDGLGFGKDYV